MTGKQSVAIKGREPVNQKESIATKELIERIFKEPGITFELAEFESLGKPIHEILTIYPKVATAGKDAGKTKYYLKSFIPFSSGTEEIQVYAEGGKSAPEEIVRQLWVYKLIHQYGYKADEIDLEKSVQRPQSDECRARADGSCCRPS